MLGSIIPESIEGEIDLGFSVVLEWINKNIVDIDDSVGYMAVLLI
jgi:hypothetical protein